jgi:hypothetical protein
VQVIRDLTSKESWRHVQGVMNPADVPSTGCTVHRMIQSRWWEVPDWLKLPAKHWPSGEPQPDEEIVEEESRKGIVPPYCVKSVRLTGTKTFPAITTRLYVSWRGSYDLSTVAARPELNKYQGRLYSGRRLCSLRSV